MTHPRIQALKTSGLPQFIGLKDRALFGAAVNNVVEKVLASGAARINSGIRHFGAVVSYPLAYPF
jgi:hypothetical protein